ncbi:glycosyltransferase family 2 protein [Aeromonas veronii]
MLYIAVVSHRHAETIMSLSCLQSLAKQSNIHVVVKDNVGESTLADYCFMHHIEYYDSDKGLGFGANNNHIFNHLLPRMQDNDYFLVLNPDVLVEASTLLELISAMQEYSSRLTTINLYRDRMYEQYDHSIRQFPSLINFFGSYIGLKNTTIIDKSNVHSPVCVDWSAGSFLMFRVDLYRALSGFNERYFMYCEDIDICWRAMTFQSERVLFLPNLKAVHLAQFNNRRFFSKHFFWHVTSAFRFLAYRYGLIKISRPE